MEGVKDVLRLLFRTLSLPIWFSHCRPWVLSAVLGQCFTSVDNGEEGMDTYSDNWVHF